MAKLEKILLINGMWRAGTTYFWSKIREHSDWRCYYEPLHEALSVFEPARNEDHIRERAWQMMRHPTLTHGYFHEYPLDSSGIGVPGYHPSMAYERFILGKDDEDKALESYFRGLIEFAASNGQRTCLQPNRLFLRATWFTHRFPCVHVLVTRHWWELWCSMFSFPNHYFPSRFYLIATLNSGHPIMQPIMSGRTLAQAETLFYTGEEALVSRWIADRAEVFRFFYHMYVCALVLGSDCADVVIDLSGNKPTSPMWDALNSQLSAEGIRPDFSDCHAPSYPRSEEFEFLSRMTGPIEAQILESLPDVRISKEQIPVYLPEDSVLKKLLRRFAR